MKWANHPNLRKRPRSMPCEQEVVHAGKVLVEIRAAGVVPAVDAVGMSRTPD